MTTPTQHREFELDGPVVLSTSLSGGSVDVSTVVEARAVVDVVGPRAEEFTVELRGNKLVVHEPHGLGSFHNDSHEVRVSVPVESSVAAKSGSASLQAVGKYSDVSSKTGSGRVEIEHASGSVVVASGSGALTCAEIDGDLRVRSGSGPIDIGRVSGASEIATGSGRVQIGRSGTQAVVRTGSGDTEVGRSHGDLNVRTGSGSFRVDRAENGSVRAKTATGNVSIGIPAGTPVWADVNAALGRITNSIPPTGKPAEGQAHVTVEVQTATGRVALAPA